MALINQPPNIGDYETDEKGQILHLNVEKAEEHCKKRNMRLPTIRELALDAQTLGATGVRETELPFGSIYDELVSKEINRMSYHGYEAVYKINDARNAVVVDFYFNFKGYQRRGASASPEGYFFSLSSSPVPDFNYRYRPYVGPWVYGLLDSRGEIYENLFKRDDAQNTAFRCVK